jgi:pimeloyl-ACP methyl ester carboxylesterase
VSATSAQAKVDVHDQFIPQHARGIITEQVYTGLRQTVSLQAAEGEENQQAIEHLRQAIQSATSDGKPSAYLTVLDVPNQEASLQVVAVNGKLNIYSPTRELLVEPEDIQEQERSYAEAILHALESIARYRILLELANQENDSRLAGQVKVRLRRYNKQNSKGLQTEDLPEQAIGSDGITLYFDPHNKDHNEYVVEVINNSSLTIYPHVFFIGADYSVVRLYPDAGQEYKLTPQKTLTAGLDNVGGKPLEIYLPDGWDSSRDYLKVIITTVPSDLSALEQGGLNAPPPSRDAKRAAQSPLDALLDTILYEPGKRHGRPAKQSVQEDWTTVAAPITVVREYQTKALDVPSDRISLGDGITLVKPEGFQGQGTVTTWGQATRGVEGDSSLEPPPGLARHSDWFEPLKRSGTRSIGSPNLVIAFDVDEASRQSITPTNPLRLELTAIPGEEVTDLLPVAFDGEDYLLAGYSADGGKVVELVNLPKAVVPTDSQGQPTARGIRRTIRLFVYKKMGRHTKLTGLHQAELLDEKVAYSDVERKQFQPGHTVALFVHGFTSDTGWMIEETAQFLRQKVLPYNHLLTWDYETFGTNVRENGEQLALALKQQCGFSADDGITVHVYAHSMGSLVARCMIELFGGDQFIDRLVMAGSPNNGSTLANVSRGMVYLMTVLINQFSIIPPIGASKWLFEQISQQGVGLADLEVNSALLQELNKLKEPSNIPYLVLAGKNVLDENQKNRLNRIAQKVLGQSLDHLFGEENDIAVGMSSLRAVRGGAYPRLRVETLPCDHFHYFQIPQGRETIRQWMTTGTQ